ncbi:MAG: alpha/beta hydrolase [Actinobacteria bacterium]|nr:alpha/beta hydrolase [Actinomycetota bacterium]MBO0788135.1 alpha/beta hydrolase [Actinomycetota bacterium]MBO0817091.1 alpha/beta hydrolase [Actinomycetota bacterium]
MLLLPGGMCSARSYLELMQQPSLSGLRLVAATIPGQAGAPSPDDYSHEAYGRLTADLAAKTGADVVAGFSMGANVALEMAENKLFTGPIVLLGISLSVPDESAFFVNVVRLSNVFGTLPLAVMKQAAGSMVKKIPVPPDRQAELAADFRRTNTRDMRLGLREYLKWLQSGEDHAAMLCRSGVPAWVVHAEKGGDGGLTNAERRTLEQCPTVTIVTIPGRVFFLPNEVPGQIAAVISEAVGAVSA